VCGIAGLIGLPEDAARRGMAAMLHALAHRGPDDEGIWWEEGVCLGQRRLSIIDTSPAGHQPMVSADGRFVLTMNGEIYNHHELRRLLEERGAIAWRGHADSEVFLEAIARLGLEEALERARGMFAFGLWDRRRRTLWLARDRLGEKPLYYRFGGTGAAFASELRALDALPGFASDLDPKALEAFFRYGYTPAPLSIYADVSKLEPGALLAWRVDSPPATTFYWRLADVVRAGVGERLTDDCQGADALDQTLREVVRRQMISDVPIGVFLSGGIDSSLVTAIMQSVSSAPVKSFTLGFDAADFDEAEHAREVARHIGTDHTEHILTIADAQAVAPSMGALFDEPFADSSQIPAYLISRMARPKVTVCLSGDGGDEMFGGYVRYPGVERLWSAMSRLPARRLAGRALEAAPLGLVGGAMSFFGPLARSYASRGELAPSLRRVGGWLGAETRESLFEATMSIWPDAHTLIGHATPGASDWRPAPPAIDNPLEAMMWRDAVDYLPGDILCKVDRAAMANGLETRAPLLDADVVQLAWRVSPGLKVRAGSTKWLLRQVLARYVPPTLTERPKVGFTVPLHAWLTGGLRDWALSLISPERLRRQGLLDAAMVSRAWRRLDGGDSGAAQRIWSVLMFQAWMEGRRPVVGAGP
jgi:asparagine synthase (glutamine-hydrolysing)